MAQGPVFVDIPAGFRPTEDIARICLRSILAKLNANSRAEALAKYLNPVTR